MDKRRSIELIILEVLGCLDEKDRKSLQVMKETDENFPWKDLAEYQNLSALFPSLLRVADIPSSSTKEIMVKKLNSLIFAEGNIHQPTKAIPEKIESDETQLEKVLAKNKIDWGSLSVSDSSSKDVSGFKEVKPKAPVLNRDSAQTVKISRFSNGEKLVVVDNDDSEITPEKTFKSSPILRRYTLISIILFVISASIFAYLFLNSKSDTSELLVEKKLTDTAVAVLEELQYNNLPELENTADVSNNQKVETISKPQSEQNVLPKAPPKLPDPIEAPLIETKEVLAEEESKVEEEISVPPPKEVIEAAEEPTYFVAVEEMPQPIGGLLGIQEMIAYPEIAKRAGIEGKVFVRAFVDETGSVTNAEIIKGIGGGCDEAALDAILKTKFTPGKQRGKPIKVQVTIPIVFKR